MLSVTVTPLIVPAPQRLFSLPQMPRKDSVATKDHVSPGAISFPILLLQEPWLQNAPSCKPAPSLLEHVFEIHSPNRDTVKVTLWS